jgi:hypothetical protein
MVAAASPSPAASSIQPAATTPAATAPAASPAAPSAAADRRPVPGIRAAILRGAVRADVTVVKRDGTTVVIHYERGEVTAVSSTSITIQGRDGKGATFAITEATRVRSAGKAITVGDLKVGDRAMVFGTASGGTYTAVLIRCVQAAAA